jgi:hypothetical protein
MDNPFVTKGYAGAEYFCDRVSETQQFVELFSWSMILFLLFGLINDTSR